MPVVENVSLPELKQGLADGSIVLIDVREANEWAAGHIEGALFNPLSAFSVRDIPAADADTCIVLHCRSGRRSVTALSLAQEAGRADVRHHYEGGMLEWQAMGQPVVD